MNKKALIALVAIVVVAIGAFLCLGGKATDTEKLIPAKADMVMAVNLSELVTESGLSGEKTQTALKSLLVMAPRDLSDALADLMEHPENLGIRFDKEAYLWAVAKDPSMGFAIELHDAAKFKEALQSLGDKMGMSVDFEADGDLTWIKIQGGDEKSAIACTGNSLIVATGHTSRTAIREWMDLGSADRYCETDRFARLKEMKGQWKTDVYLSEEMFEELKSDRQFRQLLQGLKMQADLGYVWGLDMKKGCVEVLTHSYTDNDDLKTLIDMPGVSTIDGKYADHTPRNFALWCGANMDAKKALSALAEMDMFKSAISQCEEQLGIGLERLLGGINGDMALYIADLDDADPDVTLRAAVDDDKYLDNVVIEMLELTPDMAECVRQTDEGDYELVQKTMKFSNRTYKREVVYNRIGVMGQADGTVYVTSREVNRELGPKTDALAEYRDEITSSISYVVVNPSALKPFVKSMGSSRQMRRYSRMASAALDNFKDLTMAAHKGGRSVIRLRFADQEATLADVLMGMSTSFL